MKTEVLLGRDFANELIFSASRSSGPGGQNVNKVSTRVELRFDVNASKELNEDEKAILLSKLASKLTKDGILIVSSQTERSQFENKSRTIEKFLRLIEKALTPVRKRKKTEPSFAARLKRLESKKMKARKKVLRRPVDD